MRILWIVNMVLPPLAEHLNINTGSSGTWMFDIADRLAADERIDFAVACVHGSEYRKIETKGTVYYCIPGGGKQMMFYQKKFAAYWKKIVEDFQPDIVNIHGTEYTHAVSFLRTFPKIKTVISLQGVLTRIKDKDFGGLSKAKIFKYKTLKEWLRFNGIYENHLLHVKNAKYEREMLRRVKYCMVVDDWHRSMGYLINPNLQFFEVHYNLRQPFYESRKWNIASMHRHEISTNPGGTALKGIHNLLKAVAIVKRTYPDVKVKVPGMCGDKNGELIATSGYSKYLKKLIEELGIKENVVFLGAQTTEQMLENMLYSHVQVVPSCIEGPSLVLHEGMHLGVPSIASFRGGMAAFVDDKVNAFLYDFDEYQYLALRILQIFENDALAQKLSANAIVKSEENHDRNRNYQAYLAMYREIVRK